MPTNWSRKSSTSTMAITKANAIDEAIALYSSRAAFWDDVQKWGDIGCHVHIRPDHVVSALDVDGRAWFIYLAVGNMSEMIRLLPYKLPYIGWGRERKGREPRYYPLEKLLAKIPDLPTHLT